MPERTVRVLVSGRVQGVWFRDATRREARRLGVDGWVKNRADGRVEALFQGAPAAIDDIVRWCADGPPLARVDDVTSSDELRDPILTGFTIRPTAD